MSTAQPNTGLIRRGSRGRDDGVHQITEVLLQKERMVEAESPDPPRVHLRVDEVPNRLVLRRGLAHAAKAENELEAESHLRPDDPRDWELVIGGRPLSVEGLLAAARTLVEFSWQGRPVAAVSAEVTGPHRSTDDVLAGPRLRTRRAYAAAPVANLVDSGFSVLATFAAPHVSIVLPEYDEAHVRTLIEILGPEQPNPYYMRTPR